jgi:hypothetical protein
MTFPSTVMHRLPHELAHIRLFTQYPLFKSHTLMQRSLPQLTALLPSCRLKHSAATLSECPVSVWRMRPDVTSHSLSAWSLLLASRNLSSGEKATSTTVCSALRSVLMCVPELGSHTCTSLSTPTVASRLPVLSNAAA